MQIEIPDCFKDNYLAIYIIVAKINFNLWIKYNNEKNINEIDNINTDFISPIHYKMTIEQDNKSGYKTIELSAIAKFFNEILKSKNEIIVFENTLGYSLRGIDAITKDKNGNYIIYEIKGTTRPLKNLKSYLPKTKTKGRQLTLKWCWKSLIVFANSQPTANIFLEIYKDFINNNVQRKLVIVECKKQKTIVI